VLPERSGPAARLSGGTDPAGLTPADVLPADAPPADGLPMSAPPADGPDSDVARGGASETDRLLAETLAGAGLPADGITVPAVEQVAGSDTADATADLGALAADVADAGRTTGDTSDGGSPEVELSEGEVDDVLSGRVIPIGGFFGGDHPAAGTADAAEDDAEEMAGAAFLADAGRIALDWARGRRLGLTSACGICLALAVCAAGWFSAGTRVDILRGVAALWGGYLVLKAGRWLAPPDSQPSAAGASGADAAIDAVQPPVPDQGVATRRDSRGMDLRRPGPVGWLAALGGSVVECAVYAGLAIGAAAERWAGVWTLALAVLGLVAVRNLMSVCSTPPGFGDQSDGAFRRISEAVLTMPVGGRVLLIGIVAPIWGARAALLALVEWAIISIGYGIAGRAAPGVTDAGGRRGQSSQAGAPSTLVRLRDDGAIARGLGVLVRGALLPLPPALLGLAAIAGLALLGLHGLPGALMIGPAVVMLLAAPGSGHPHTGRFDWLVPVLLLGSQLLYIAAIGVAARVPGAVIFVLSSAILLRYTDLAYPGRPVLLTKPRDPDAAPAERGTALGWEGRMLFVGVTAAMGIATYAYLALTAYLGVLICAKVVTSCLAPEEDVDRS